MKSSNNSKALLGIPRFYILLADCFSPPVPASWSRKWQSTPVFLPGEFHWSKRFTGYNHGVAKSRVQLNKNTFTFIFMWSILKNVPSALEKNVLSAAFRWNAIFMYIKLIWSSVQFSHSVVSDYLWPHEGQYTRPPCPWDFPGRSTGVGCHCLLWDTLVTSI